MKSFPVQIAEPGRTYYLSENLSLPFWTYWKVPRLGSRGPAGLITYQKTFPGRSGLIRKFPVPARGARPDLLLIRKLFLAILDLLKSFPSRLAEPGRTYYLSENLLWPFWTWPPFRHPFWLRFWLPFWIQTGPPKRAVLLKNTFTFKIWGGRIGNQFWTL